MTPQRDGFGRPIDYLRISVTDRCNLRCVYCMPDGALSFLRRAALLTPVEIETVAGAALSLGFRKIRITGGEPTLRAELLEIVERLAGLPGLEDLALTTNGVLLPDLAAPLKAAGLRRVNVHLDSMDPAALPGVMRHASLDRMLAGIEAAETAGLLPIKLNAVMVRDGNEDSAVDLARTTIDRDRTVRFIELMPLGPGEPARVSRERFVSNVETRQRIEAALGSLRPLEPDHESDEARNFRLPGALGRVGFISPVSEPYCGTCNRMRLTAEGKLHLCLLHDDEIDLRKTLRHGGGADEVGEILRNAILAKPTGHALAEGRHPEQRRMNQIGG